MRTTAIALTLAAFLVAGGCSKKETSPSTSGGAATVETTKGDMTPEQLGELGAEIKKNPSDSKRLLSEKGLDEKTFEQAIRKVSEDPAASQRYAAAYKKASA